MQRYFVRPSTDVRTGRRQTGAQTPGLEQTIFVQGKEDGLSLLELRLGRPGREFDISVAEFL
jgi:hypothetical protein